MRADGGQLLLILAGREAQTLTQLARASDQPPSETLRQLQQLVDHGFIVAATPPAGVAFYRLNPKGRRTEAGAPQPRILLIEDDVAVQDFMALVLEEQGYGVIVARAPADGETLLREVAFDLVIAHGFNNTAEAVLADAEPMLSAAGITPVALFTAHQVDLDAALAAGFRALLA